MSFQAVPKMRPNTDAENVLYRLSMKDDSRLYVPVPKGLALLPYQIAGVEYANASGSACLFADPMGLGKTIEALAFMNFKCILRAVIIAPTSVQFKWKREIEKWHVPTVEGETKVSIYHPSTFTGREDILVLPYYWVQHLDVIKSVIKKMRYQHLIIDECHFLKNPKAARTKHVLASNGLKSKADFVHALSGTPIVNRPSELYPTIKSLAPGAISNMDAFEYGIYFCGGKQVKIQKDVRDSAGRLIREGRKVWQFDGASNLKLLGLKLRSTFMVRRRKEDVLKQLPDKFPPNIVYLSATGAVTSLDILDAKTIIKDAKKVGFTEISKVRREIGELKIGPAAEYIKDQLDAGHQKIVVFVHHTDVAKGIEQRLEANGIKCVKIIGETNAQAREYAQTAFEVDETIRVFIGSIGAASTGIDLVASSYVIIVEPSWVPGENEQAIDRVHRIGQTKGVQTDYLVFPNSLDMRVLKYILEKTKNIKEIMGA